MVLAHDGGTLPIRLVCLDLAGTTIGDVVMVERAFAEAIATQGIVPGTGAYARAMVHVHRSRGRSTLDVFRGIFPDNEAQAQAANLTFERSYEGAIGRSGLVPAAGIVETLDTLRDGDVKVCLTTGFSRSLISRVLADLSWSDRFDLVLCTEDVGRGRPMPDMVLSALLRLRVQDVRQVAVAGDSENDMLCGRRAGASVVAGIMTGAHSRERLLKGGATHILDSVRDLPSLVLTDRPAETPVGASAR
ncbi:HAD-IA family hydrolase [Streptosporangium sp. NPDC020145]|uniref:HAD-IA family hydrolase n=1 Tax=Streptosporangium jomthongense TaxID=1193683 RepID=A0ABV8EWN6_9ACTN